MHTSYTNHMVVRCTYETFYSIVVTTGIPAALGTLGVKTVTGIPVALGSEKVKKMQQNRKKNGNENQVALYSKPHL